MEGEDKRGKTGEKGIYSAFLREGRSCLSCCIFNKFIVPELGSFGGGEEGVGSRGVVVCGDGGGE